MSKKKTKPPKAAKAPKAVKTSKPKAAKAVKNADAAAAKEKKARSHTKLQTVIDLLTRPEGATLQDIMDATSWQQHTVRGAIAGAIKKRGYRVVNDKPKDGNRIYKIADKQQ